MVHLICKLSSIGMMSPPRRGLAVTMAAAEAAGALQDSGLLALAYWGYHDAIAMCSWAWIFRASNRQSKHQSFYLSDTSLFTILLLVLHHIYHLIKCTIRINQPFCKQIQLQVEPVNCFNVISSEFLLVA